MKGDPDRFFEALASPARRQILAYLAETEQTTSDLTSLFAISAPAISRHLSLLERAGLVTRKRSGQFVKYGLARDAIAAELTQYLLELCGAEILHKEVLRTVTK